MPVFAVGRAEALLHAIAILKARKSIPRSHPCAWTGGWRCRPPYYSATTWGEHHLNVKEARINQIAR